MAYCSESEIFLAFASMRQKRAHLRSPSTLRMSAGLAPSTSSRTCCAVDDIALSIGASATLDVTQAEEASTLIASASAMLQIRLPSRPCQ
ncbi:hypothetical protein ASE08_24100 [Rhizobacter sp. Root16D2]|nr:hypothetical protein ASC88_23800 [Rhizobacter sp. Root29]KQW06082.1 hypothetical protein ASC98_26200 [Rhizobacter sp. Root1238]KRB19439.1 hypothetical protein ASE08_24100 [Rhizobacter sp. Root16D2]